MFDQLKEAKHFKEIADFKNLIMKNRYKRNKTFSRVFKKQRRIQDLSMMKLFCEYI